MSRLAQMSDDLAKLDGTAPYDGPSNICRGDPYFAQSLEQRYQMSVEQMRDLVSEGGTVTGRFSAKNPPRSTPR